VQPGLAGGDPVAGLDLGVEQVLTVYPGTGAETAIGTGAVIRSGEFVYAGTRIASETVVGHQKLRRASRSRIRVVAWVKGEVPEFVSDREPLVRLGAELAQ
jgi:hypothetical protein